MDNSDQKPYVINTVSEIIRAVLSLKAPIFLVALLCSLYIYVTYEVSGDLRIREKSLQTPSYSFAKEHHGFITDEINEVNSTIYSHPNNYFIGLVKALEDQKLITDNFSIVSDEYKDEDFKSYVALTKTPLNRIMHGRVIVALIDDFENKQTAIDISKLIFQRALDDITGIGLTVTVAKDDRALLNYLKSVESASEMPIFFGIVLRPAGDQENQFYINHVCRGILTNIDYFAAIRDILDAEVMSPYEQGIQELFGGDLCGHLPFVAMGVNAITIYYKNITQYVHLSRIDSTIRSVLSSYEYPHQGIVHYYYVNGSIDTGKWVLPIILCFAVVPILYSVDICIKNKNNKNLGKCIIIILLLIPVLYIQRPLSMISLLVLSGSIFRSHLIYVLNMIGITWGALAVSVIINHPAMSICFGITSVATSIYVRLLGKNSDPMGRIDYFGTASIIITEYMLHKALSTLEATKPIYEAVLSLQTNGYTTENFANVIIFNIMPIVLYKWLVFVSSGAIAELSRYIFNNIYHTSKQAA